MGGSICNAEKCTGCLACFNVCRRGAIIISKDIYGRIVPQINTEKCVQCNQCVKVCPVNTIVRKEKANNSYAVWSKCSADIKNSSSGGVAAVFSREIIQEEGVVFGVTCKDERVINVGVDTFEGLETLRGSKYVQCDIGLSYREVQHALQNGKKVLFIGTPCQVAGLKNYTKDCDDNLVTIDLICHGVPPQDYLLQHIKTVMHGRKWDKVTFRGEYDSCLTIFDMNGNISYQESSNKDSFYCAFINGMILRENCYHCQYATIERCSDITIGDFWGLERSLLDTPYEGKISVVLPNTEKGMRFFYKCRENFIWKELPIETAQTIDQTNLREPSERHEERNVFLHYYPKLRFDRAFSQTQIGKEILKRKYKNRIKKLRLYRIIRQMIKS